MTNNTEITLDQILTMLPHRYPFLLIDRILDHTISPENSSIKALKNVTINEPFFQGHFPTQPIMPGVLILEGMAQAAGALLISLLKDDTESTPKTGFFAGIDKARFRKPVTPGDQLIYDITLTHKRRGIAKFSAIAFVDDAKVATAELMIAQAP